MVCPKCGSEKINVQAVAEAKRRGCFTVLLYIFLACTILGIFILIPIIRGRKTKIKSYAVCQNCGNRWQID